MSTTTQHIPENLSDLLKQQEPNTWKNDNFRPLKQGGFHPLKQCMDSAHMPPSHMVFFQAGHWICPSCGHETFIMGPATCVQL